MTTTTPNKFPFDDLLWGFLKLCFIAFILAWIWLSAGCSTVRKDNKAVDRVLANVNLLDRVGVKWEKLHPMIPGVYREKYIHDTTVIKQPAKIILDEMRVKALVDSMAAITDSVQDNLKEKLTDAYNLGAKYAEDYYRSLPPKHVVDTVKRETPDLRHEGILNDQINNLNILVGTQNGQLIEKDKDIKKLWSIIYILGGVILLLALGIGVVFKTKLF